MFLVEKCYFDSDFIRKNNYCLTSSYIGQGTVEERMQIVQARKQRMISGALTDHEVRAARIEELKMLFT